GRSPGAAQPLAAAVARCCSHGTVGRRLCRQYHRMARRALHRERRTAAQSKLILAIEPEGFFCGTPVRPAPRTVCILNGHSATDSRIDAVRTGLRLIDFVNAAKAAQGETLCFSPHDSLAALFYVASWPPPPLLLWLRKLHPPN